MKHKRVLLGGIISAALAGITYFIWWLLFAEKKISQVKTASNQKMTIKDISKTLPKNGNWPSRSLANITDITIHHTASGFNSKPEDVANWHLQRKWPGIAYHFLVDREGNIYQTNPVSAYTWHNGFNNAKAIGISMIGNFETDQLPAAQFESVVALATELARLYPQIKYLVGHIEYKNATLCPGQFTNIAEMRNKTGLKVNPVAKGKIGGNYRAFSD